MATTPNRAYRIIAGGTRTVMRERSSWIEFNLADIASQGRENQDGVLFQPGFGWRLMEVQLKAQDYYDQGKASDQVFRPGNGNATVAQYADDEEALVEQPTQRALLELGGTLGTQSPQGAYQVVKDARPLMPMAGGMLPPDTSYPVPLERSLLSNDIFDADDHTSTSFYIPGRGKGIGPVYRYYFPGLAGTSPQDYTDGQRGTGRYCMVFGGDGIAYLEEYRDDAVWVPRASYRYCGARDVLGTEHVFRVSSDAKRDGNNKLYGKAMYFGFSNVGVAQQGSGLLENLTSLAVRAVSLSAMGFQNVTYNVPGVSVDNQPVKTNIAADARQDCSVGFSATRTVYDDQGTLRCNTFALKQPPSGGIISIQVFGYFPTGTSIELNLYETETGSACARTVVTQDLAAQIANFVPVDGKRSYRLVVTLNASSDRLKSPTVSRVRAIRPSQYRTVEEPEVEITNVVNLTTTGAGSDPSTETLSFRCYSLTGLDNTIFDNRSGIPVRVESYDSTAPDDESKRSVIFRGRSIQARRVVRTGKGKQGFGGTDDLRKGPLAVYTVKCIGEWDRLRRRLAPGRIDLAFDADVGGLNAKENQANLLTDMVRYLLTSILPDNRVDVPHKDFRLPLDQDFVTTIEKFQPILPIVVELLARFTGAYLVFDPNASPPAGDPRGQTDEGMWRVIFPPKTSELKPVAEFWPEPVVEGISPVHPAAYPPRMDGDRPVLRTFLRQSSGDSWVQPAEANMILVRGAGAPGSQGALSKDIVALEGVAINYKTAQFAPDQGQPGKPPAPDVDDVDYQDGDIVMFEHSDPALNSAQAVAFYVRRLYDTKCHARRWHSGEAPMILLAKDTTEDPLQVRPRPMRFGDPVTIKDAISTVTEDMTGRVESDGLFILDAGPSVLIDGRQGGSAFSHAYYAMFSAPPNDSYRATYGEVN